MTSVEVTLRNVTNYELKAARRLKAQIDKTRGAIERRVARLREHAAARVDKRMAEVKAIESGLDDKVKGEHAKLNALQTPETVRLLRLLHVSELDGLKFEGTEQPFTHSHAGAAS